MSLLLLLKPSSESPAIVVTGRFNQPTPTGGLDMGTPTGGFDMGTPSAAEYDRPTPG